VVVVVPAQTAWASFTTFLVASFAVFGDGDANMGVIRDVLVDIGLAPLSNATREREEEAAGTPSSNARHEREEDTAGTPPSNAIGKQGGRC